MDKYLPIFQKYSREFISKIHPDRHHGYPDVQKVNASATSIIHNLFKFDSKREKDFTFGKQFFDIHFYKWDDHKSGHLKLFHRLLHSVPFDCASGKSALNLFQSIGIPIDFSIINDLASMSIDERPLQHFSRKSSDLDMKTKMKYSCIDLETSQDDHLSVDLINFIRRYPNIQLVGKVSESKTDLAKVCRFLIPNIKKLERAGIDPLPIILLNANVSRLELCEDVITLPIKSSFAEICELFDIFALKFPPLPHRGIDN